MTYSNITLSECMFPRPSLPISILLSDWKILLKNREICCSTPNPAAMNLVVITVLANYFIEKKKEKKEKFFFSLITSVCNSSKLLHHRFLLILVLDWWFSNLSQGYIYSSISFFSINTKININMWYIYIYTYRQ